MTPPMTLTDTVRRMPNPKRVLSPEDKRKLRAATAKRDAAADAYRATVLELLDRSSFQVMREETGLSKTTLQEWKKAAQD